MIPLPNKISICLNAPIVERAIEQKNMLSGLEAKFEIEWDIRAKRHEGLYSSFSQMINESVYLANSEFIIFINPKANPTQDDIEKIINDLCSGFCLSTIIAFGFWGTTKQLFREIGLLDERFIGGGWEDLDFMNRIKVANKAVRFRYYYEQYLNNDRQNISENKVIAHSIYHDKWLNINGKTYVNSDYVDKKLPIKELVKKNENIANSWLNWNESKIDSLRNNIWKNINDLDICTDKLKQEDKIIKFIFSLGIDDLGRLVAFVNGELGAKITFVLTQQKEFKEFTIRNNLLTGAIESGKGATWIWKPNTSELYSIRIAVQGRIVYQNDYVEIPHRTQVFNIRIKSYNP